MATLDTRIRALEAARHPAQQLDPALAAQIRSEVQALVAATACEADRGVFLAGLLQRLEDGSADAADLAITAVCSTGTMRLVRDLENAC